MRRLSTSRTVLLASWALVLGACTPASQKRALPPLSTEGELLVYLEPFAPEAARLSLFVGTVAAVGADASLLPLETRLQAVRAREQGGQRLLASGRLPPGRYGAVAVQVTRATLSQADGTADLVVPAEPVRLIVPFRVQEKKSTVVTLSLRYRQAVRDDFEFTGDFIAATPPNPLPARAAYCPADDQSHLVVFDKVAGRVVRALPTGRGPRAVAIDESRSRLFVALEAEDAVQIIDAVNGDELLRTQLTAGDRPREIALTADRRQVVVTNAGSNTVSFLDAGSGVELARAGVGQEPSALLVDRLGLRAFVLNSRSNDLSVIDLAKRVVAATVPTDAQPVRAQLDRAGSRLYVAHAGSPYVNVLSVPALEAKGRVYVGLGARALKLDTTTNLLYVGLVNEPRLQVFDPMSLSPVDSVDLPSPAAYIAIDGVENTMLVVMPDAHAVGVVELTGRRLRSMVDVGADPGWVAVAGERP